MALWHFFAGIARAILPASFIRWLRGDFKSVYGRVYDKYEQVKLFFYRLKGGKYIDWYARRMDRFAKDPVMEEADKRAYHDSGVEDLETLKQLGLKESHRVHEFGCGFLRSAYYLVRFLERGRFSCNDASGERIQNGIDYIKSTYGFDMKDNGAKLIVNTDNSFDWLDDKPEVFWCHAVFTHMPEPDIEDVLRNLPKVMAPESVFYFTYSQKKDQRRNVEHMGVKDWWHRHEFFADIAARHGLAIEDKTELLQARGCYNPLNRLAKLSLA